MRSARAVWCAAPGSRRRRCARTCLRRLVVLGPRQQRDRQPGRHAAAGKGRDEAPVASAARQRVHLHDRRRRRVLRTQSSACCWPARDGQRPGKARPLGKIARCRPRCTCRRPSVGTPMARMPTASAMPASGARPDAPALDRSLRCAEDARQRDRHHRKQDLAGPESDPRRLGQARRSRAARGRRAGRRPRRCTGGVGSRRDGTSPTSAGTSTGPSDISSVSTGAVAREADPPDRQGVAGAFGHRVEGAPEHRERGRDRRRGVRGQPERRACACARRRRGPQGRR